MQKNDITLCVIAKNEEKGLKRAVDSARACVGDVIIGVDTGSTDNTLDIARSLTPNVFLFKFNDDFSEARNNLAACVKSHWILWLDGHEYLDQPLDFSEFTDPDADGYLIKTEWDGGMIIVQPKFLRKDILYHGKLHEQPDLKKPQTLIKPYIVHDRLYGQAAESVKIKNEQRQKMTDEIMVKEVQKNKKNLHAILQLAMYRHGTHRYKEACHYYEQYLKYQPKDNPNFLVYLNLALCQLNLNRLKTAEQIIKKGLEKCGDMWELNLICGNILAARGKHIEAITALTKTFDVNTKPQMYFPFKRENWKVWDMIANEFYQINEYEKAATSWRRAAEIAADPVAQKLYSDRAALMIEIHKTTNNPEYVAAGKVA